MSNLGQLAFDLNSPDMEDRKLYPRYGDVTRRLEVIQEAGQIIFVPSGWHHQVFNLVGTGDLFHGIHGSQSSQQCLFLWCKMFPEHCVFEKSPVVS